MSDYAIFPAVGVARVGNAPQKFYVGPEVYRGLPQNPDGSPFTAADLRDEEGRMARQAARFRIFRGKDEITLDTPGVAAIEWTVHVANKKATWYQFQTNVGEQGYASNHPLRNPTVADRHTLLIDAGPRSISGRALSGTAAQRFSRDTVPAGYRGAHFPPSPLYPGPQSIDTLGELQTDAAGRLLFLGGHGVSGTADTTPAIGQYANNDGWWDDTSDGPVAATVVLDDGTRIDAGTAWVMVAPPAYAPQIANLVTLYDTIFDAAVKAGHRPDLFRDGFWRSGPEGYRPSFRDDIGPLLERGTLYAWVAAIPPKPHRFDLSRLGRVPVAGEPDEMLGLRQWILEVLRPPAAENQILSTTGRTMMPYLAGDNALIGDTLTSKYLRLTDTQFFMLQQWAEGWFVAQGEPEAPGPALTRAVLENCVGGAFSPGIEMTWISRNAAIYQPGDPFRINADLRPDGPLDLGFTPAAMEPGDVSRYMAVPWQADFNECSSQPIDGRVLWWWPAQRPEYVFHGDRRGALVPASANESGPGPADGKQTAWVGTDFDQLGGSYISFSDDLEMVERWSELGFVLRVAQPGGEARYIEVARTLARPGVKSPDGAPQA